MINVEKLNDFLADPTPNKKNIKSVDELKEHVIKTIVIPDGRELITEQLPISNTKKSYLI